MGADDLTKGQPARQIGTIFSGAEVSQEELSQLCRDRAESKASPDECAVLELLETDCLNAYLDRDGGKKLRRGDLLRLFFATGNATRSALRCNMSDRTAQDWVADFCVHATEWLQRRIQRKRAFEVAQAQCEEMCDRKGSSSKPSFGPERWHSREKTRQEDRAAEGGRCAQCPLHQLR